MLPSKVIHCTHWRILSSNRPPHPPGPNPPVSPHPVLFSLASLVIGLAVPLPTPRLVISTRSHPAPTTLFSISNLAQGLVRSVACTSRALSPVPPCPTSSRPLCVPSYPFRVPSHPTLPHPLCLLSWIYEKTGTGRQCQQCAIVKKVMDNDAQLRDGMRRRQCCWQPAWCGRLLRCCQENYDLAALDINSTNIKSSKIVIPLITPQQTTARQ